MSSNSLFFLVFLHIGCEDSGLYNHKECLKWKGWNLCGSSEWGQFMEDHCKKSCGLCTDTGKKLK